MSIKIAASGLHGMINDLRDMKVSGPRRVQQSLDGALERTAEVSRGLAHVWHDDRHAGALKASQRVSSEHGSGVWTGGIAYGDRGAHWEIEGGASMQRSSMPWPPCRTPTSSARCCRGSLSCSRVPFSSVNGQIFSVIGGLLAFLGTVLQVRQSVRESRQTALVINADTLSSDPEAEARQAARAEEYERQTGHVLGEFDEVDEPTWKLVREATGWPIALIGTGSVLAILGDLLGSSC